MKQTLAYLTTTFAVIFSLNNINLLLTTLVLVATLTYWIFNAYKKWKEIKKME